MNKEKEFFTIAKEMNDKFAIIPLLFGSVALNMLVEDDVYMGDLDISIPHYMRPDRKWLCPDIIKLMENMGYEFVDMWEGEFHKDDIWIHTAGNNIFKEYANVDVTECPIMQKDGAIFKIMSLEQQVKIYTATAEYKHNEGVRKEDVDDEWRKAGFAQKALARKN